MSEMTNDFIALELVKAWCMQPSTASNCFTFQQVLDNYRDAVTELDRFYGVEDDTDCGESCEDDLQAGTDDEKWRREMEEKFKIEFAKLKLKIKPKKFE